jgi:hypothetical protein
MFTHGSASLGIHDSHPTKLSLYFPTNICQPQTEVWELMIIAATSKTVVYDFVVRSWSTTPVVECDCSREEYIYLLRLWILPWCYHRNTPIVQPLSFRGFKTFDDHLSDWYMIILRQRAIKFKNYGGIGHVVTASVITRESCPITKSNVSKYLKYSY